MIRAFLGTVKLGAWRQLDHHNNQVSHHSEEVLVPIIHAER
jgi:hypothetical protein